MIERSLHKNKSKKEAGNILFATLLVMMSMNFLAIGFLQFASKENRRANIKTIDSTNFYLNETCIEEMTDWLKSFTTPPDSSMPHTITRTNTNHLNTGFEDTENTNQLSKYSYNCTIDSITTKSVQGQEVGIGKNIVATDAYGSSGDLSPTYFYDVVATSTGPNNYTKVTNAIISVKF